MKRTARVDHWVDLHVKWGMSTQQIADLLHVKKNTVLVALRNRGMLRQAPGKDVEKQVFYWLAGRVQSVMKIKGDRPYDLLVNGKRIDIKSAIETKGRAGRYMFMLHHRNKRSVSEADAYWFVLKDRPGRPIYHCKTSAFSVKYATSIAFSSFIHDPKYTFVGFLEEVIA